MIFAKPKLVLVKQMCFSMKSISLLYMSLSNNLEKNGRIDIGR